MRFRFLMNMIKKFPLERDFPKGVVKGVFDMLRSCMSLKKIGVRLNGHRGAWILILCCMLAITSCTTDEDSEVPEVNEDVEILPDVVFSVADDRELNVYIESQGIVEASREIVIRPRISGFAGESVLEDGARVQQGDLLLQFDDEEWQYQLQQAENEHETALAAYNIETGQRQNRNGGEDMADDRIVRISTGLADAETALNRAKLDLSYTSVRASFPGHLSVPERITNGAYLQAGNELGRLIDDRTVRIRFDVLESELAKLSKGMIVELNTPSGTQMRGGVQAISPVVDSESKTGTVVVEAENPERTLRPGMTVEGRIEIESHSGMARIPRSAILERDGDRTLVFKLNGNTVEWVYVEPEIETSDWAIVNNEDINPGDTLAVDRHFALTHLQKVRPRMAGEIVREGRER